MNKNSKALGIGKEDWLKVSVLACKALYDPSSFEIHSAFQEAEIDWNNDCKDSQEMSKEIFHSSLFEVADMWTTTPHKEDYVRFLRKLHYRITKTGDSASRTWRDVSEIVSFSTLSMNDDDGDEKDPYYFSDVDAKFHNPEQE